MEILRLGDFTMNDVEFMRSVYKSYMKSIEVLMNKGREYGEKNNRLVQFYRVAEMANSNPCEALVSMASKHFTSLITMSKHPQSFTMDEWTEKTTDLRNYTYLLEALLKEVLGEEENRG